MSSHSTSSMFEMLPHLFVSNCPQSSMVDRNKAKNLGITHVISVGGQAAVSREASKDDGIFATLEANSRLSRKDSNNRVSSANINKFKGHFKYQEIEFSRQQGSHLQIKIDNGCTIIRRILGNMLIMPYRSLVADIIK